MCELRSQHSLLKDSVSLMKLHYEDILDSQNHQMDGMTNELEVYISKNNEQLDTQLELRDEIFEVRKELQSNEIYKV